MHGGAPLAKRDRLLACAIPLLMLLTAGVAVVRHHRVDQSPWQAFSLGMFSTHDSSNARTIRATTITGGRERPQPVPSDLARLASRVLVAPGDSQAEDLGRALLLRTGADRVVIEIWRHDIDPGSDGLRIGFTVLRRVEVP